MIKLSETKLAKMMYNNTKRVPEEHNKRFRRTHKASQRKKTNPRKKIQSKKSRNGQWGRPRYYRY